MKAILFGTIAGLIGFGGVAFAQQYNAVPAGDAQFLECLAYSQSRYTGGAEASKIPGQTKAEAWCTCMWNETPDNFRGSLARFAETDKGAQMNALCERYSGWNS